MRKITSKNPFTGEVKKVFEFISDQELRDKLDKGARAFQIHRNRTFEQRQAMIRKLGAAIEKRSQQIAQTITFEMGKTIAQSQAEVKKSITFCNYYGSEFVPPPERNIKTSAKKKCVVKYLPTGLIYFIVPFNFPFFLHFKGGIANLLFGNVVITRSPDSCPIVGKITEQCMNEAGFTNGEYQDVCTDHTQLDLILQHKAVSGVSFTGSSRSGAMIAAKAGQYLKKAVMELGGNDPFVVLEDGDVELAIPEALKWRCVNAGQVCTAPKRFIIHQKHYDRFKEGIIEGIKRVKFGDPMARETQMGPLARQDLYDNLQNQLKNMPQDFKIVYQRQDMKKPFFPISVIQCSNVEWDQELFGPCFQLFKIQSQEEALKVANFGSYGLGSSVFSASRGEWFSDNIRSGIGFVNSVPVSDHVYPIGGVGKSGFGRECEYEGYIQFANVKTHYEN